MGEISGTSRPLRVEELTAWVALHAVEGMGAASLGRLLARFGSPQGILRAPPEELELVPRVPALILNGIVREARRLDRHRAAAERLLAEGVLPVGRDDPAYPSRLHSLASPPPLLYVRGSLPRGNRRTLGIVGTTQPSQRGSDVASAVARRLASKGWIIVSGHARGIDAAAHLGAFQADRPTILVLPTGILAFRPHPGYPGPERLWRRAAVLSEWHPEARWDTRAALARNRVIAALSDVLLVVETRERGGALSTLRHAIALERRTFVVRYREPALSAAGNPVAQAAGAQPVHSVRELESLLSLPAQGRAQRDLPW